MNQESTFIEMLYSDKDIEISNNIVFHLERPAGIERFVIRTGSQKKQK